MFFQRFLVFSGDFLCLWPYYLAHFGEYVLFFWGFLKQIQVFWGDFV